MPVSTERTQQGDRVLLQLTQPFARWFKVTALIVFFALYANIVPIGMLATRIDDVGPSTPVVVALVAVGLVELLLFFALVVFMTVSLMKGEVIIDQESLRVYGTQAAVRVPTDEVLSVRMVMRNPRAILINPSAPPRQCLHRGPAASLEIETSHGRVRALSEWGVEELTWIADELSTRFPRGDHPENLSEPIVDANRSTFSRLKPPQRALLKRYRVFCDPRQRTLETPAIVRWSEPVGVALDAVAAARREAVMMAIRMSGICSVVAIILRLAFQQYAPFLPWNLLVGISLLPAWLLLPSLLMGRWRRSGRGEPRQYAIDAKGVLVPSRDRPRVRWESIDSFTVEEPPRLAPALLLRLHLKLGQHRDLPLPTDAELVGKVIAEITTKLPQRAPLARFSPLRRRDYLMATILTIAYVVAGLLWATHHADLRRDAQTLFLVSLIAGPGTLFALLHLRRRAGGMLFVLAFIVNLTTTMILALSAARMMLDAAAR